MGVKFTDENIQRLFGAEAAESDDPDRLRQYYFKGDAYENITSKLPLRILVGHKGIGKSALITVAIQEDLERGSLPVLIQPSDITNLRTDENDFIRLIQQWKSGLNEIIVKKAFDQLGIPSGDSIGSKLKIYGDKIASFLTDTISTSQTQKLSSTQIAIAKRFVDDKSVNVYLDDLDRGWDGNKTDIKRMSALLNAARDISRENPKIRFKIALRSDVYFLVRTSDESTDKIEGAVVWYSWTNHEILAMLVKRVETFFGGNPIEADLIKKSQGELATRLSRVMETRFLGRGKWADIPIHRMLMTLVRKRPRDLVKLCTLAAKRAQKRKSDVIQSQDWQDIFEEYSQGRIQDTVNEYRTELPDLERLVFSMKPTKRELNDGLGFVYTTDILLKKLVSITKQGKFIFHDKKTISEKELAAFLYKINFLTARKELKEGLILRKYFEENRYLSAQQLILGLIGKFILHIVGHCNQMKLIRFWPV